MTDDFIIRYFYSKTCLKGKLLKNIPLDILNYLNNRYVDSKSIKETLYRIKNNIETRPKCIICGKDVTFKDKGFFSTTCSTECTNKLRLIKIKKTLINKYGVDNPQKIEEIKIKSKQTKFKKYGDENYNNMEKYKKTCLDKYGYEYFFQSDDFKEKNKKTCLDKYRVEYSSQIIDNKQKSKQTCLDKYGYEYFFQSDDFKEKSKRSKLEKYGNENYCNSYLGNITKIQKYGKDFYNHKKYEKTCLEKYGVRHWKKSDYGKEIGSKIMLNSKVQEKRNHTLKENNTYNSSNIEIKLKQYFIENNINFIYQYKSKEYPFNCDFYLINYNLYLEINASWTHGGHPYDPTNIEDKNKLNVWKYKNTKYYDNAIKTWTIRDVIKRNIAKENNLNYLEIFSNDFDECIKKIKKFIIKLNLDKALSILL